MSEETNENTNRVAPTEKFGVGQFLDARKAFEDEAELKELREAHSSLFKAEDGKPEFDPDRVLTFIATDETPDRAGDIVRVDGGDVKDFLRNPVFLKQHDYDHACGRVLVFKKIKNSETSPEGKAWIAKVYFPKEVGEAEEIFMKYKHGVLNAVSIRFIPTQTNRPSDPAERKKLGLGDWGYEILKWQMVELSAVSVPCNPNALRKKEYSVEALTSFAQELKELLSVTLSNFEARLKELEKKPEVEKEAPRENIVKSLVASIEGKEFKL
jgi:hypothetical protein